MLKKSNQKGFTIIEVLIVLAIAGLIMLIVFLAVPALQRNSRNTQRKNDVASVQGAVQEYTNNNSGNAPTSASQITDNVAFGYYDNAKLSIGTKDTAASNPKNIDTIVYTAGTKCGSVSVTSGGTTTVNANSAVKGSSRQGTLMYSVEDSKGNGVPQCMEV